VPIVTLGGTPMPYSMKPLSCDPQRIDGVSEKLLEPQREQLRRLETRVMK
jgi:hypothetical protein